MTEENHSSRSNYIRALVQRLDVPFSESSLYKKKTPKRIVQFWDNLDRIPYDVSECIETWRKTTEFGFELLLFDDQKAGHYIYRKLGLRYKTAYEKCYHPAMKSDYFRLCYVFMDGGCYIDADDIYSGSQIKNLFNDGRLKIQPLCYDTRTNTMVSPAIFTKSGVDNEDWIFYFNNNPLIASNGHPIIKRALSQATLALEDNSVVFPEIQSTTGPGNLTKAIFDAASENKDIEQDLVILSNWEEIAISKWELSYRNDARNWRLSNCQEYIKC